MAFRNRPRYQRARQKVAAFQPHQRAILNAIIGDVDQAFIDDEMKRRLWYMRMGQRKKLADREFAALRKYRSDRIDLARDIQNWEKRKDTLSDVIAAFGVPLGYYQGLTEQREKEGQLNALRRYLYGARPTTHRRSPFG